MKIWWKPATRSNLDRIAPLATRLFPVGRGELASRLTSDSRMAEPEEIVKYLETGFLSRPAEKRLAGRKALVTARPHMRSD